MFAFLGPLATKELWATVGSKVWGFITHASFWQLTSIALAVYCVALHFTVVRERHESAKWEKQASGLQQQINSISTAKNVQKQTTTRTVEKVIQGQKQVQTIVRVIHDAPNPPDCKTPALDTLRGAV